jgi:hypothetical protein
MRIQRPLVLCHRDVYENILPAPLPQEVSPFFIPFASHSLTRRDPLSLSKPPQSTSSIQIRTKLSYNIVIQNFNSPYIFATRHFIRGTLHKTDKTGLKRQVPVKNKRNPLFHGNKNNTQKTVRPTNTNTDTQ